MNQNKVFLIGRIGQNPENVTVGGTTVTKFSLATSEKWKDKETGETKELTQWHRIEAWGKRGTIIAKYHEKGDPIAIEGQLIYDKWETKEGEKRITAKVRVSDFTFIKSIASSSQRQPQPQQTPAAVPHPQMGNTSEPDDLPF
jgi:single-strand DNA-binding protein